MHKKIILRVNLICKESMDVKASQEILNYFFPYQEAIPITITKPVNARKVTIIHPPDYAPEADLSLGFIIRSKKELYAVLASLIYWAIQYLNETNYHKAGVVLTITVPKISRYHRFYKLGWKLEY